MRIGSSQMNRFSQAHQYAPGRDEYDSNPLSHLHASSEDQRGQERDGDDLDGHESSSVSGVGSADKAVEIQRVAREKHDAE